MFEYYSSGIFVHQKSYIKRMLEKYGLGKCNPCRLLMHPSTVLTKNMGIAKVDSLLYRSIVGSLKYVCNTRLDICFAVSTVSRFMESPEQAHFNVAKQILRYLSRVVKRTFSDGRTIGRSPRGRPWLGHTVASFLKLPGVKQGASARMRKKIKNKK
jgi:hypothetical protein